MSPVFRHGRLRLYLLKLLDEAPRHGYEVIRLLQDRFMGVYAPSPGTIYPRLARLEEEGLVTHDEADGRKVYRITDKGREELRARYDDLAELEEEITASVRDIAQEVSEDVRQTVRSLREELASAARGMRGPGSRGAGPHEGRRGTPPGDPWHEASTGQDDVRAARDQVRQAADAVRDQVRQATQAARDQARQAAQTARDEARHSAQAGREQAKEQREQAREQRQQARAQRGERAGAGPGEEAGGQDWGHGWGDWSDWSDWQGWADWPGRRGRPGPGWGDPHAYRDMERLARQFTREFRRAAEQAQTVGEEAVSSMRDILEDALQRIRTEVFGSGPAAPRPGEQDTPGPGEPGPGAPGSEPGQGGPGQSEPGQPGPGRDSPGNPG
ncbi:MAG: helix-turn-helix transcriptional regulator [Gemmatimonadota bacterium]